MIPRFRLILPSIVALVLAAAAGLAHAQQAISLAEADLRAASLFQQAASTGMVLVVVRNREVMVKGYGETAPGSGMKPDAQSLIRLCSLSKVFTGELLLDFSNEGKLRLDDPLQRFAPAHRLVPKGTLGTPITLEELATHTSGVAREVGAYPPKIPHFTFPDYAQRWAWLPRQKLLFRPGTAALYSNVGFDLLGDALASAAHKPYAQILNERIVGPLGLRDTTLSPGSGQCARLLRGSGDEGACTDTQASGASGGVYSTGTDMVRVLEHLLQIPGTGVPPVPPGPGISVYLKPGELKSTQGLSHAGEPTGIGLAWIQIGDPATPSAILQKTGGGAGFETYIALSPKMHAGVFFAVTEGKGDSQVDLYHEANVLLAALANVPELPAKIRSTPAPRKRPTHRRSPNGRGTP